MNKLPKYMQNVLNLKQTTNSQYVWLKEHRCKHRHNYLIHFNCFLSEYNIQEKIGFLDIEASNLKANFGIMLCWCILSDDGHLYEDWVTVQDVKEGIEDKRIVETCIDTMRKFNRICGHFSTYYDIPFIRTRALIHGIEFPEVGELCHTDVWKMAKKSLCIHSNRQDTVAEALLGRTVKTRIDQSAWRQAMMGNKKAMQVVVDHCEKDVQDLRDNFNKLKPFVKLTRTSI
jgi:DNA polymerase elongation subunit (family B)